ncbi:MAG: DNA polymerase III subunit gamma/tau [Oscillospiraceae bacterium]|nr:DNA polymerase III subunit gamma/tau [Oscillospiraceae bacterium]
MYQALYRKYRPRFFRDVAGQEHITSVLSREVAEGTFGHAYLFTGSRGIGKTTCAKILAKAVNCPHEKEGEPCGECEICRGIDEGSLLDITEMDAASNRNIDDIRDLRSEANFTPAVAKYRVYIIDEAHMLTKEAANALLKIMEEPPEHVIFILATTEVHRLPATILSRCMRFDYRRMPPEVIAERVKFVCKMERIDIEDDAAMLIGKLADGGMRDALSLLDICRSSGEKVTADTVSRCAGLAGREYLFELTDKIAEKDISAVLKTVDKLYEGSADVSRICDELINHFRNLMVVSCAKDASSILKVLPGEMLRIENQAKTFSMNEIFHAVSVLQDTLVKMAKSASKRLEFELALVKLCTPALSGGTEALLARIENLEKEIVLLKARGISPAAKEIPAKAEKPSEEAVYEAPAPKIASEPEKAPANSTEAEFEHWEEAVEIIRKKNGMLFPFLDGSKAYLIGGRVLIDSPNEFFIGYMQKNDDARELIKNAITEACGTRYGIGPYKKTDKKPEDDPLAALAKRVAEMGIKEL